MESTDRLRELILSFKGKSYRNVTELAQKAGVSQSTLSDFLAGNGKREQISFKVAWKVMEFLGFYLPEPNADVQFLAKNNLLNLPGGSAEADDMQALAVFDTAGAGPGREIHDLIPFFLVKAPSLYLRKADYAVLVQGHSMEPRIPDGSIVGVKTGIDFRANDLYLARIPYEGYTVKHITFDREKEEFVFHSYNPDKDLYPDFRINVNESPEIIVGRVVWITIPN